MAGKVFDFEDEVGTSSPRKSVRYLALKRGLTASRRTKRERE